MAYVEFRNEGLNFHFHFSSVLSTPFPSIPLVALSHNPAVSSPSGSGRSLAAERILVHCEFKTFHCGGEVVNALVIMINEVTRRTRLVLGWVTVCGRVKHLGM